MINSCDHIDLSISIDVAGWSNLISSKVVVSDEGLSWLVNIETVWEFLSSEEESEGITSIVWMVDLADLYGIVSQVVVDHIWEIIANSEETEHLAVMIQELLLGCNLTTSKGFLEELLHLSVLLWCNLDLGLSEVVVWASLARW